jgi:hypothetical protein
MLVDRRIDGGFDKPWHQTINISFLFHCGSLKFITHNSFPQNNIRNSSPNRVPESSATAFKTIADSGELIPLTASLQTSMNLLRLIDCFLPSVIVQKTNVDVPRLFNASILRK